MSIKRITSYVLIVSLLTVMGYIFFALPVEKDFLKYEIEDCDYTDSNGLISIFKDQISFKNNVLKIPEKEYLASLNYCSFNQLNSDLIFLKDSMGLGEGVEQPYFELISLRKIISFNLDLHSFDPKNFMDAILLGERALLFANNSNENKIFFRAYGRFWLDTISNSLTAISEENPSIKYDENFKILTNRCSQNKFSVDLNYTNSEKLMNYLVNKRYAYIINRIWIGTSVWVKIFLLVSIMVTTYAYFLFFKKIFLLIKNKLS